MLIITDVLSSQNKRISQLSDFPCQAMDLLKNPHKCTQSRLSQGICWPVTPEPVNKYVFKLSNVIISVATMKLSNKDGFQDVIIMQYSAVWI